MRIVFDSNIFVAALVFPTGKAAEGLRKAVLNEDIPVLSPAIISEVLGVLSSKFSRDKETISRTAILLSELGTVVQPTRRIAVFKDDPDNRILECAVAGKADAIITGDKVMLQLKVYEGIQILSLKEYLEK